MAIYFKYLLEQVNILHLNDYVHGNLDPEYIVPFDRNDGIIILDSFLSVKSRYTKKLIERRRNIKTLKYTRPESETLTKEDDLFSLGLLMMEMCLSEIPLKREEYSFLTKEKIQELMKNSVSQDLINIIVQLVIDKTEIKEILARSFIKKRIKVKQIFRRCNNSNHVSKINIDCNISINNSSTRK